MSADRPSFVLPALSNNAEAWGPNCSSVSSKQDDLFQFYSKDNKPERHWKISDWSITNKNKGRSVGGSNLFAFKSEEDDSNFSFVEKNRKANKRGGARGGFRNFNSTRSNYKPNNQRFNNQRNQNQRNQNQRNRPGFRRHYREEIVRDPSVPIKSSWELVDTIDFNTIPVNGPLIPEVTDLVDIGVLPTYDSSYNTVSVRRPVPVVPGSYDPEYSVTASADPTIASFVASKAAQVYSTEAVVSLLMAAHATVHPWDILVRKTPEGLFLDKRPDSNICATTVHETGSDILPTDPNDINSLEFLSKEATLLSRAFTAQVFDHTNAVNMKKPAPANSAPVLYRYRKFDMNGVKLLVRAVVHGVVEENDEQKYVLARMLNEFDSKIVSTTVDWRSKFESQQGAIFAGELKNNSTRMMRIAAESFLAGADLIKLGFISRTPFIPKDISKDSENIAQQKLEQLSHEILKVDSYIPRKYSEFLRLTVRSFWASFKFLVDELLDLEDGKYVILKDPTAPQLKVFKVPDSTFNSTTGEFCSEVEMN